MKKIALSMLIILFSAPVFAQMEQGQQMVSLRSGLGFQLQNSGITYSSSDSRADWGSLGVEVGLSYHYLVTDQFAVGAEFSYGDYEGANLTFSSSRHVDDDTRLYNFMLSARYTTNPASRFRFYIPFGAGLVAARQDLDIDYDVQYAKKKTDTSFGYFIGAGIEFDLGHNGWALGFETRYNAFWYDTDKLVGNAPAPIHGDGNRRYEYMNFNIHVIKRF